MQTENRTLWFDNLRVIAVIGVIGIHVSSAGNGVTDSNYNFWVSNFFNSLSRFGVPVFVMLSGALLLPKEEPIGEFLKKRLLRILFPFIFWSFAYITNSLINDYNKGVNLNFEYIIRQIFIHFRDGSTPHFWYIYMIIGLYLFIPIIGKWIRNSSEKDILYFLVIWFIVLLLNQPYISKIKPSLDFSYYSGYLGYLVLGHYLTIKPVENKTRVNLIALCLIFSGLIFTVVSTYIVQQYTILPGGTFYNPLSINILIYSTGIFLWFRNKNIHNDFLISIRNIINKHSYGIFLVHIFILSKLDDFYIRWNFINPLFGIPFTIIVCLFISTGIIFVISKFPLGKYISG